MMLELVSVKENEAMTVWSSCVDPGVLSRVYNPEIEVSVCLKLTPFWLREWDVAASEECLLIVQWVVGSILRGGLIELFLIPTSAPRLV